MDRNTPVVLLEELIEAAGGFDELARECGVDRASLRAWLDGTRHPSVEMRFRLAVIARNLGVIPPLIRGKSGPHAIAPEFVSKATLQRARQRAG
jgi:hypothetical protein